MKASESTAASLAHRTTRSGTSHRMGHWVGVIAALSLLAVSTTAWAEPGVRASVEVDARQPVGPWGDPPSWRLRYVRWAPAGHGALGLSMGVGATEPVDAALPSALRDPRAQPTLSPELGVRWRSRWAANHRVDVGAFSRYDDDAALPQAERRSYNARVELQFRESRTKYGFDMGSRAFGLQLNSNSRVLLRTKHGGPMVYYRSTW